MNMTLNRRLDDLINLLMTRVLEYFVVKARLQDSGRIASRRSTSAINAAGRLMSKGWLEKVTGHIHRRGKYVYVPSETTPGVTYKVVPAELYCECEHNTNGGHICKHLHVCMTISQQSTDLIKQFDVLQQDAINQCIVDKGYIIVDDAQGEISVESPNSGETYYAKLTSWTCTCTAFAHHGTCFCLKVAEKVCKGAEMQTMEDEIGNLYETPHDSDDELDFHEDPHDTVQPHLDNGRETCIQQLTELLEYVKKDNNIISSQTAEAIKRAHQTAFSNFKPKVRKRRLKPLFPGRAVKTKTANTKNIKISTKGKRRSISKSAASANASNDGFAKITNLRRQPKRPRHKSMKTVLKGTMPVKLPPTNFIVTQDAYDYIMSRKNSTKLPQKGGVRKAFLKSLADTLQYKYNTKGDASEVINAIKKFFEMM